MIDAFLVPNQAQFLADLPPQSREYKIQDADEAHTHLELQYPTRGWGSQVRTDSLEPSQTGGEVIVLRNRLMAMGYLSRTATRRYDVAMEQAVQAFQLAHGLEADGVAGTATIAKINVSMEERLKSVIAAMERERWFNRDRGRRHILVNLTDFHAQIIDNGAITFRTRPVIGKDTEDRRTPEFSDVMVFMVINPSWYVSRSIATEEYPPKLNRNAASYLELTDSRGRRVNWASVNFGQYSAKTFPYAMLQPPSESNALRLVKFMFPDKYNIYYALLALQDDDPEGYFPRVLKSGNETRVDLEDDVPIHLIYRTAFTTARGGLEFRRDIYERDTKIWSALSRAGVALEGVQG